MANLIAVAVAGGPQFVETVQRIWDDGDAIFVIDDRLPAPARERLVASMAPSAIVDDHGERHRRAGGVPVEPGDALVVATSGSTGEPKGAIHTHATIAASAVATSRGLSVDPTRDHWLACLPLAHIAGMSVVCRALHTGTPLTVLAAFEPAAVHAAVDAGATLTSLVPTALARIDPLRFRKVVVGGASPPADPPPNAVTTYGMTETGSGLVYDGVALEGVEVRVDDHGEIWLRAPMLLRAYRTAEPAGRDPKTAEGWFATADLGALDAAGRLVVHGRRGDVIVTGGEKVWPEPVERALQTHPAVHDVAVGGKPDPEWGHRVVAYVVSDEPALSLAALRDHVKAVLPAYMAPRELVLVKQIPKTALGKIRRGLLG